ncbi:MAG TPA: S8 family serine peptidase [Roseiflexaceae bacterium]|nr:S8 family serine peptidase [Roseiflexaceae bacterium]HMP40130.1 S8 family serine peptidase [Roseiflexaceae bacterium]
MPSAPAGRSPVLSRDQQQPHDPTQVLIRLRPGAVAALPYESELLIDGWYIVPVLPGETAVAARQRWLQHPDVLASELDLVVQIETSKMAAPAALKSASDDPYLAWQWHMAAIEAPQAWNRSTGSGVVVAVIDSGVSPGPDLACRTFVAPYNAITQQEGLPAVADDNGHGTHVSGTVAQCTNNGVGGAGVAYDATIMPIKVCSSSGGCSLADIARGIDWARLHGADVINLSLGADCAGVGNGLWPDCSASVVNQAIEAAIADDITIVAAAGNANQPVVAFPANHPSVIAVGAIDAANGRAPYSSYGSGLSVMAPGGNLARDDNSDGVPDGVLQETTGTGCSAAEPFVHCLYQGTSMAAPHVAGAVALLRAAYPQADCTAIQQALEHTALDLGVTGFDTLHGHGAIQVDAALDALATMSFGSPPPAPPTPTATPIAEEDRAMVLDQQRFLPLVTQREP